MKGKKLSVVSEDVTALLESVTMTLIAQKGWTTEQQILQSEEIVLLRTKSFTEKQFKRIIGEMLDKYNLQRVRLNKKMKEELGIDVDGYPYVIKLIENESITINAVKPSIVISPKFNKLVSTKGIVTNNLA